MPGPGCRGRGGGNEGHGQAGKQRLEHEHSVSEREHLANMRVARAARPGGAVHAQAMASATTHDSAARVMPA